MDKEKTMRRQSVTTTAPLSPEQRQKLVELGCEATPYIARPNALLFAYNGTEAGVETLKSLDFVTDIKNMMTFGPC